jgi:hypothetical protein
MIRKLLAAAAVSGAIALAAPSAAFAGTQSSSFTLPVGNRVCLDSPTANVSARGEGTASPGVRFTLYRAPYAGAAFSLVTETPDATQGWVAQVSSSTSPSLFPGVFRACARNNGTRAANVNLSLITS